MSIDKISSRKDWLVKELARVDGVDITTQRDLQKHLKMATNPFRFYRGSAQLFYADLATGLIPLPEKLMAEVLLTSVVGDCHLANFGFFTEGGSHGDAVIFAPNDFDDACVGCAAWDLLRFGVSLYLAADFAEGIVAGRYISQNVAGGSGLKAFPVETARDAIAEFLRAYQQVCLNIIHDPEYRLTALDDFEGNHVLAKPAKKARERAAGGRKFLRKSALAKAVDLKASKLKFKKNPERYQRLKQPAYDEIYQEFRPYVDDQILDIVQRLGAGTGSVNMARFYLLVGPEPGSGPHCYHGQQDLALCHLVEVKQQREAAPLYYFPHISPVNSLNPAHLTIDCQRKMQRKPDLVLDEKVWRGQHWLIRSRHHARVGIDPEDIVFSDELASTGSAARAAGLKQYAASCGAALALAHARGDPRSTRFEQVMVDTLTSCEAQLIENCETCKDIVCRDWELLNQLLS